MISLRNATARVVTAVLVTAAAAVALPAAPAGAAYCSSAGGVSALVDFGELGGGTATGCGSGSHADDAFKSAGFTLSSNADQPEFVCKVQGKPADGRCLETDAYWAFFVSDDGKGWVYASKGVYSQPVDAGDSVALVWQSTQGQRTPPVGPAAPPSPTPSSAPAPTKSASPAPAGSGATGQPKPRGSAQPGGTIGSGTPGGGAASTTPEVSSTGPAGTPKRGRGKAKSSATASAEPSASASASASASGSPSALDGTPSDEASATETATIDDPTATGEGGLPGWVPPALVGLLAALAGAVAWARRAR